jgi:PKHD-type hydroxylase
MGLRTDRSFTLRLSDRDSYVGGELVLESPRRQDTFRLPAGYALVSSTTLLHRVEPVSQGERLVAVGWIESRIRQAELFDLISRSYSNLLRLWDT